MHRVKSSPSPQLHHDLHAPPLLILIKAYIDSLDNPVASQSAHVGRLMFGPVFSYALQQSDGTIVEPHVSFTYGTAA